MAGSFCKVMLMGHLGQDPQIRPITGDNRFMATFSVAENIVYTDRSNQRQTRTVWHDVTVFAQQAVTFAQQYLRKGDHVMVEGKLEYNTDAQGRVHTNVTVRPFQGSLTANGTSGNRQNQGANNQGQSANQPANAGNASDQSVGAMDTSQPAPDPGADGMDDDIPF